MQLFGSFICTQSTLHVLGDVFAHHQEHLTVFTASDIVHLCCCRLVSWTSSISSRQQHRWTISEAVNTVKCSWWWVKTSPETCRADWVQMNEPESCILLVINYESLHAKLIRYNDCCKMNVGKCNAVFWQHGTSGKKESWITSGWIFRTLYIWQQLLTIYCKKIFI